MMPPLPASAGMLAFLARATGILHTEQLFAHRLNELHSVLHTSIGCQEMRLTCWLQSTQPGATRQRYSFPGDTPAHWDDGLMRQAALARSIVRRSRAPSDMPDEALSSLVPLAAHLPTTAPAAPLVYLGAPVRWHERLWGVLEMHIAPAEGLPDIDSDELLYALLPQLAVAIAREGASNQQRVLPDATTTALLDSNSQSPHASALAGFSHALEAPLALQTLLEQVLQSARELANAEAGAVCLVDHQRSELVMYAYEGYHFPAGGRNGTMPQQRWSWDTGLVGRVARSGRAMLVRDVTQETGLRPAASHLRAELAVPILLDNQVRAVLALDSPRSAAFGDSELKLVRDLCERAAQPLHRALHYQELLEDSNQLGQVFGSLPTGLALLDSNGDIVRINPAWALAWGITSYANPAAFRLPDDLTDALYDRLPDPTQITDFFRNGQRQPDATQMMVVHLTNPLQELKVLSVPTRDSQQQLVGRLWAVTDATSDQEVDRLKNEFVSIVSHELRTPLTSILGYTELLLARSFEPAEQRNFIETVYSQANHLAKLVDDLLSLSRLDSGNLKLNCWVVDLRQLLAELPSQLARLERHRLLIRSGGVLPPVQIDRDKVKQVLLNLITNAIKYSPQGGEIELSLHEATSTLLPADHPPGHWLLISVRDQGMGIAPDDLKRIWERFYRVDNTNTRRIGGTGLGLSIARALVELHGGRIWADSTINEGTMFSFTLPIANRNNAQLPSA